MTDDTLRVEDLRVHFPFGSELFGKPKGVVRAVDGVSFALRRGEVVGLVGESGCGKTTVARSLLGLVPITEGRIIWRDRDLVRMRAADRRRVRRNIQMVFQDPFDSLNPRRTVFQTLEQPLNHHAIVQRAGLREEVVRLLDMVGMSPGAAYLNRYPHQLSGGQRQRICIARAISLRPSLVVADEAVSALDISIRAQILTLLRRLQSDLGLGYLFITHDLGVVRSLCDRVIVMYLGKIVEEGTTEDIFRLPRHPYTRALLAASPISDPVRARARHHKPVLGDVPSPSSPPAGCHFHPRCAVAREICSVNAPVLTTFPVAHRAACHFADEAESWAEGHDVPVRHIVV